MKFNKEIGSNSDIGLARDFLVHAGEYECIYNNMRCKALRKLPNASITTGAGHRAMGRLGRTDGSDAAVAGD